MALVRTEGDAILDLITLEDVLEEFVGYIEDEHDRPTPKVPRGPHFLRNRTGPQRQQG